MLRSPTPRRPMSRTPVPKGGEIGVLPRRIGFTSCNRVRRHRRDCAFWMTAAPSCARLMTGLMRVLSRPGTRTWRSYVIQISACESRSVCARPSSKVSGKRAQGENERSLREPLQQHASVRTSRTGSVFAVRPPANPSPVLVFHESGCLEKARFRQGVS